MIASCTTSSSTPCPGDGNGTGRKIFARSFWSNFLINIPVDGLENFLDMEIINRNNGGSYVEWNAASSRWQFNRLSNLSVGAQGRPYVDLVAREIEDQDRRIRE